MKKNTIFKYCASLALGLALSSSLCASYDVTTVAGVAGSFAHTDGVGSAARFKSPGMMSIDISGNLLEPDGDKNIRKITTAGGTYTASTLFDGSTWAYGYEPLEAICQYIVSGTTTYLTTHQYIDLMQWTQSGGTYVANFSLDQGGAGYASGNDAWGLVVDSSNNIFMTSSAESKIYKILPNGSYSSFVQNTALNGLTGITIDSSNNLYVSATSNNTICKITSGGVITTIAGTAGTSGSTDAAGSSARFNSPWDIDIDAAGNLYVADRGNNLIRKLTNNSGTYTASTIAGTAGSSGSADGTGSAALFNAPTGLAVDAFGYVFVTDTGNNTIRRLAPPSISIEVNGSDSATVSGAISTGTAHKTGTGTLVLAAANTLTTLDIQAGQVNVSATNNFGGGAVSFTTTPGGILAATAAVTVPVLTMTVAGELLANGSGALTLGAPPAGDSILTLASTNPASDIITVGDLHASTTPVTVTGFVRVGAGTSLMTAGATLVSTGTVEIMGATAASFPGVTEVQSGGVLQVSAAVSVPATGGSDLFTGTLKFDTGSKLILGNDSTWARNITVGTAS